MNKLIKLIIEYQNNKDEELLKKIITKLDKLICKYQQRVKKYSQDDIKQIILIKIYKVVCEFKLNYQCLLDYKSNDTKAIIIKYHNREYNLNVDNISNFISQNESNLNTIINSKEPFLILLNEYILFNNENQFYRYIVKTLENVINSYYNQVKKDSVINYTLNDLNLYGEEYIDYVEDKKKKYFLIDDLNEIEKKIVTLLSQNYTEKEIGKKLSISQQAVNKRKKKIKEKIEVYER